MTDKQIKKMALKEFPIDMFQGEDINHDFRTGFEIGGKLIRDLQPKTDDWVSVDEHNKKIGETRKSYSNYIQHLEIALEESIKGLKWRMDNDPKSMDKSDYEKIDEWTTLIHELPPPT